MNIILFSKHGARCRGLRVGTMSWIGATLVFGGLVPGAAFYAGLHSQGPSPDATPMAVAAPAPSVTPTPPHSFTRDPIIEQQVEQRLGEQVNAMAPRLARLQAQAARLDAIANRLLKVSGADPAEFQGGSGGPELSDARRYTRIEFGQALEQLSDTFQSQQALLDGLDQWLIKRRLEADITPSGWPIDGGWVSSHYGPRSDPISSKHSYHHGVDIAAKRLTPIHAVAAGIVSLSGTRTGYGRVVEVTHGNGYVTVYAHTQRNKVTLGQRVKKGETIALVGSSGRSTGPHLHFEVRHHGDTIDPEQYLRASR